MDERGRFLAEITTAPEDDAPRLVFADWLDDRGDPLGEFIRLQVELEPWRRPRADPREELERVRRLHQIPPGEAFPRDDWPLARQLTREGELLRDHQARWLREAAPLAEDEEWTLIQQKIDAGMPFESALREAGYEPDQITEIMAERKAEQQASMVADFGGGIEDEQEQVA